MCEGHYVLAMYDVRSKQEFIYNGRKIKEIIGASHIIEDVFEDYLYPAANDYGNQNGYGVKGIYHSSKGNLNEEFSTDKFIRHIEDENYLGEVVYEGGGNFLVLYRDKDTCIGINKIFTKNLMENVGTLKVLCTWIPISDFDNYKNDRDRLYELHHIREGQESVIYPVNTLPFVQVSPSSGRPLTNTITVKETKKVNGSDQEIDVPQKVTTEEYAKYDKYDEYIKNLKDDDKNKYDKEEFLLDNLVYDKGNESLLAVIYIDRNGMGAAVQDCLKGKTTYDACVNTLREFSSGIQTKYIDDRINKINRKLEDKHKDKNKKVRRTIVAAGDEMTIICNARDALDVVEAYFTDYPDDGSSCVGVAIFHSHAPYADAYRIAEECCENAKNAMKNAGINKANLMDFYYCQGGIDSSLEKIRERESDGNTYSKPWEIKPGEIKVELSPIFNNLSDYSGKYEDIVNRMAEEMSKVARGNIKDLRQAAESGRDEFEMEIKRITAHNKDKNINFEVGDLSPEERKDLIYDISIVYDLWFRKEDTEEGNKDDN